MPFPWQHTIDPDWSTHHADAAAGGMNATVQIHDPGTAVPGWDPVTESATTVPGPAIYTGPARIQEIMRDRVGEQTDQSVGQHDYRVQLPMTAPAVTRGCLVAVTACGNDPDLVTWTTTRPLSVIGSQYGSERFTRDLDCVLNLD